ncbi:MAG: CDP-alcohol phosphatidyltransferase family protein [bacterium]|nr:CDP-alcohol phosphatidyltransferase family protein [bacterium]MDD6225739.1 CDP-alcohol phosphatidyltransferase family protein [bacterium]MDY3862444.1 CDP-alcohol phosphatidyltransferase family protein [Ruminococcus sp.]
MGNKEIKPADFVTIPNLLTYLRILLIAPFVISFIKEQYILAMVFLGISALSDCCDGYIARRFNQITALGKMLDPVADKLTLLAVMVCITIMTPQVLPLMVILIIKDVSMLIGGTILLKKGLNPPAAKWYGKLGTIMFYGSVIIIVFLKAVFKIEIPVLDIILLSATAFVMIFALVKYFLIYKSLLREKNNKNNNIKNN